MTERNVKENEALGEEKSRGSQVLKVILMVALIVITGLVGAKILIGEYSNPSHIIALAVGAMVASFLIFKL
jgi:general stress protein CsbA